MTHGLTLLLAQLALAQAGGKVFELAGRAGLHAVSVRLEVQGRRISGHSTDPMRRLSGQLGSTPPSEGLASCHFSELQELQGSSRVVSEFHGVCAFTVLEGQPDLSFEGVRTDASGRRAEPVKLESRRAFERRALRRYGALLPVLVLPPGKSAPKDCASTIFDCRCGARSAWRKFRPPHATFRLRPPRDEPEARFSAYAAALSVVDETGPSPTLRHTASIAHPLSDETDVVAWGAGMTPVWLEKDVLGLAVVAGGTISGSGSLTTYHWLLYGVTPGATPRLVLTLEDGSFGKSGMSHYQAISTTYSRVELDGQAPHELLVTKRIVSVVDDQEQPDKVVNSVYRFDRKEFRFVEARLATANLKTKNLLPFTAAQTFEAEVPARTP